MSVDFAIVPANVAELTVDDGYYRLILPIAALWDVIIGDPLFLIHPVQVMGWLINGYVNLSLKLFASPWQQRLSGVLLGVCLIVGSGWTSWFVLKFCYEVSFWLGFLCEVVLLASCFAGESLRRAAQNVLEPLSEGDLVRARSQLSMYVGRDTDDLSETEILRAVLETVGENAVDGVTAPLFYAIVGTYLGVGAVPLALAYKAASTLDSMVGYLRLPYTYIGWFSAQLEDRLTWLPCRLTVLTIALFSGRPLEVLEICRRDGVLDPSPNSGWSECAYAATLGVRLGGTNFYQGEAKVKPFLGEERDPITSETVCQALQLTRYCFWLWLAIAVIGLFWN